MNAHPIQQVRSFNRTVAEGIGALDERFLGRARPMGESRLLWEIGIDGVEVRALRTRLGLDSGYISRTLRALEKQGFVVVETCDDDRRVRKARLTKAGLAERAELDRRSDSVASHILESLNEQQRATLVAAMAEVERLLQPSLVRMEIEDPTSDDARACFDKYFAELDRRFETGFDPALSLSADAQDLTPPAGELIVARLRGSVAGCVALKFHKKAPAELKRMWVSSSARGLGIARQLLAEAERHAQKAGARAIRLETNRGLTEAINLYRRSGYIEVDAFNDEPYAHHWFEKKL